EYTRQLLAAAPSLSSRRDALPARTAATDAVPFVEIRDLRKEFPVRGAKAGEPQTFTAVDGVSLTIRRGTTVSIVGESGSGKSTTANMVLGLEDATSGSILFDGLDPTTLRRKELFALRRRVQPVFQNPYASLDPRFTVEQSIAEPLRVHRIGTAASRHARVLELLEQVALPAAMAERLPHELSGGQRQRVAIARALALEPELVVLDEAVSALDVLVQDQILRLLGDLQREYGLSYLFISHDLAVVRLISDYVCVMKDGKLVEAATSEEIFTNPRDPYTRRLLASIPGNELGIAS
ncbi:ABC transporter ATP-binding protein, partial [Streptomyces phaeoluteigriseus]|uniref:ABC transporter ATP-binding protein n=1 Tax=Streptomyces phaeoluteigriseus TaxID=114686 RepID=UPI0036756BE9